MDKKEMASLVNEVINGYKTSPVDLLSINDAEGELLYLQSLKYTYTRTISDILNHSRLSQKVKVLEIGTFLGLVSICLSKLGYDVYATDIPEFISNKNLQMKFHTFNVRFSASNLNSYSLPYADEMFDIIVMCEVLEHLNFNPLPVIKEINRVSKSGCLLYLSLPNIASWGNRIRLLKGKSIHDPIEYYFKQLDPNDNMIVGLHWREYTIGEVKQMLEPLGFAVSKQYYFSIIDLSSILRPRNLLKKLVFGLLPSLKEFQITFAVKIKNCDREFFFTDATTPR